MDRTRDRFAEEIVATSNQKSRRFHLNEKAVRALDPPASGNRLYYDDLLPGFALRITAAGARSFVLNYYSKDGRERRVTVGAWPAWSTMAARERAKELRREIDLGQDPLEAKDKRKAELTFAEVAAEYLERHAAKKKTGAKDAEYLNRDVLPKWGRRKANEIRRREVIALVEAKAESAPVAANRLLALLRKVFNWAIERDILESNPCTQVKAPAKETAGERVLSPAEIRVFWQGLEGRDISPSVGAALRLILATAQRPGEVLGMEWRDLDLEGAWWTIPGEKAKNGLAHRVPLNAIALELLRGLEKRSDRWVFPSPRGSSYIATNALAHALRRNRERIGVAAFTPHDLRRTAASLMASAGVQRFHIARVLNHVEAGVTRVYDRHSYDPEKRNALDAWNTVLEAILARDAG